MLWQERMHSLRLSSDFHMNSLPYVWRAYAGLSVCTHLQPPPQSSTHCFLNVGKKKSVYGFLKLIALHGGEIEKEVLENCNQIWEIYL